MNPLYPSMLAVLGALAGTHVAAQTFPAKTVRIIVAFPAGGGTDIAARVLGQKLAEQWGQQVIVDNRAGASGIIGTEIAARSAPDGYTMFMGTLGNLSANKHLFQKMTVDPVKDFTPLTQVVAVHFVMISHPSLPAKTVKEVIALARSRPGQLAYGSSGPGGAPHLAGELFKMLAKVDIIHIPYKGSAPSMQDLIGGQIMLGFDSVLQNLPFIRSGQLRAVAVLGKERTSVLPNVPTAHESGLPGYELTNWFGLVLPGGTPAEIVRKIYSDVGGALKLPDVQEKFAAMGASAVGSTPEQFGAFMRSESEKWGQVIKVANIRAE
jgi:tripartite-type tricarboxylate transporter receptor subunit TctC